MNDIFLTTAQVAEMLQVHPLTVLKYMKEGKLKGVKLGRVYRIKKEDVFIFIDEQAAKQASKPSKEAENKEIAQSNIPEKEEEEGKREEMTELQEEIPIEEQLSSTEATDAETDVSADDSHYII
jgi:excisionase family DNA binding protein